MPTLIEKAGINAAFYGTGDTIRLAPNLYNVCTAGRAISKSRRYIKLE